MQRLNMLQGYHRLAADAGAVFQQPADNVDQARLVKFRIITERDVVLKVGDCDFDPETGEVGDVTNARLLTVVKAGFDEVEFHYRGTFALEFAGSDEIWLDTFDGAYVETEASDLTNYARTWEREEVDPRILEIERAARHNQMILQQQMQEDFARHAAAMEAKYAAAAQPTPPANGGSGDQSQQQPPVPAAPPAANPPAVAPPAGGDGGEQNGAS